MDKLIHYVNLDGRVNAFYSTPEAYVDAKHSFNASWPLKTDDFFPYSDCPRLHVDRYTIDLPSEAASRAIERVLALYTLVIAPGFWIVAVQKWLYFIFSET